MTEPFSLTWLAMFKYTRKNDFVKGGREKKHKIFLKIPSFREIKSAVSLSMKADKEEILQWLSLGKEVSVWKLPPFHVC